MKLKIAMALSMLSLNLFAQGKPEIVSKLKAINEEYKAQKTFCKSQGFEKEVEDICERWYPEKLKHRLHVQLEALADQSMGSGSGSGGQ